MTFPTKNGISVINHTFVDESLRGQGVASGLVKLAAEQILAEGNKIGATCPYAVVWFQRHPEYSVYSLWPLKTSGFCERAVAPRKSIWLLTVSLLLSVSSDVSFFFGLWVGYFYFLIYLGFLDFFYYLCKWIEPSGEAGTFIASMIVRPESGSSISSTFETSKLWGLFLCLSILQNIGLYQVFLSRNLFNSGYCITFAIKNLIQIRNLRYICVISVGANGIFLFSIFLLLHIDIVIISRFLWISAIYLLILWLRF